MISKDAISKKKTPTEVYTTQKLALLGLLVLNGWILTIGHLSYWIHRLVHFITA